MRRFFIPHSQITDDTVTITDGDVNHIKNVLRMQCGDIIDVNNGKGDQWRCRIKEMGQEQITAAILEKLDSDTELPVKIYLFQGLPKMDKMEFIIQKAVELGVHEIIPVHTKRAVVRLDGDRARKKLERWKHISESAAKQAGRGMIPAVKPVSTFVEALAYAQGLDAILIPYENAENIQESKEFLQSVRQYRSIGIMIGPEGGFDRTEVEKALSSGAKQMTLGKRILRTETAGMAVLAILMFILEE